MTRMLRCPGQQSLLLLLSAVAVAAQNSSSTIDPFDGNHDQFNYRGTDKSVNNDYGPQDWDKVRCASLDETVCLGWPDDFREGVDWSITENFCSWCPASGNGCGTHHQSPINLQRGYAVAGDPLQNDCIDVHWMAYHDSSCTFETLREKNAFKIARHALKIQQPVKDLGNDMYQLDCVSSNNTRRFGRIDFSKGYSQWWQLSHADFHVPSEHTQEDKRYDGEIHLYHFYSADAETAGIHNEMASVTFFMQAYDNTPDWDVLNRIICEWRRVEEVTRQQCQLPSVTQDYPGCYYYTRGHSDASSSSTVQSYGSRNLRGEEPLPTLRHPLSAYDIIMHNQQEVLSGKNASATLKKLLLEPEDHTGDASFNWDEFIAQEYARDAARASTAGQQDERHLLGYDEVDWFNYFGMLASRTEYYYRYSGSQTVPPCYGEWIQSNERRFTNAWRIMKDPIRISQRQLYEMHRLLKERIAPATDPLRACQADTAAAPDANDAQKISVARPLQSLDNAHHITFCECQNWNSKWVEDREWCQMEQLTRYYDQPYNFFTDGF